MTNTLKLFITAAFAAATLSAHAGPGILFRVDVTKGRATGGVGELRLHDSRFFRMAFPISSPYQFDWNCEFFGLGNPTNLSHVEINIKGSRLSSGPIKMQLFDYVARRWTDIAEVNLPAVGVGEYFLRIRRAPERFVSAGGRATIRFKSTLQTMIVDQLTFKSVRN